ncbi:MAG: DUF4446 family protein [Candidatus Nealsonbacteria bacterium]|nr:DUF4446 family protein [Candidatus Nealsonbacteria bacterium]
MFKKKEKQEPENIQDILRAFEKLKLESEKTRKELQKMREISKNCLYKFSVIRYNPFSNIGGDQSFSIAILNGEDDGLVITSLLTSEGTRVYTKPIKNMASEYELSGEEKKALEQAKNNERESK